MDLSLHPSRLRSPHPGGLTLHGPETQKRGHRTPTLEDSYLTSDHTPSTNHVRPKGRPRHLNSSRELGRFGVIGRDILARPFTPCPQILPESVWSPTPTNQE